MATGTVVDVVMPQMGVSVSEGTVTRWLKNVGDTVQADEPLLEISTDKVDTEVPSPGTGVLQEILVQEGETVDVGTLVARIGPADGVAAAPPAAPAPLPASVEPAAAEAEPRVARAGCRPSPSLPPRPRRQRRALRKRLRRRAPRLCLSGRRADRLRARDRSRRGHRDGPRRPGDQEGHPGLRRVAARAAPPRPRRSPKLPRRTAHQTPRRRAAAAAHASAGGRARRRAPHRSRPARRSSR